MGGLTLPTVGRILLRSELELCHRGLNAEKRKNTKDKESKAKEDNVLSLVNVTSLFVRFRFDPFCLKDYTLRKHQSSKSACEATKLPLCLCSSLSIIITSRVYFVSPSSVSR